jgi:hypothetical protein
VKVLIGVDPHKAANAVAALDEHGEVLECAEFSADRRGLRALERWAKRFPERRWAIEGANGLGRTLSRRLVSADEEVVDVPAKLSARVRVLSVGNGRKNDELDATFTALAAWRNGRLARVRTEEETDVSSGCSPRGARIWSPSAPGYSTACTGSRGTSSPVASRACSLPTGPLACCAVSGPGATHARPRIRCGVG